MILENIRQVRERISRAAQRAGRAPGSVKLMAVTKYAAAEQVNEALKTGLVDFLGENRVQDAAAKRPRLIPEGVPIRLIGHLQSNKVNKALEVFDGIDSLDSLALAEKLDARLKTAGKKLPVLVQVKLTENAAQSGVAPDRLESFLAACAPYGSLEIRGLMAIAPNLEPVEAVRPHFRRMFDLRKRLFPGADAELSMGMSRDFEIAIEEGATMVRLGSALFA